MKRIFLILICSLLFNSVHSQIDKLPSPSGKYFVGVTYLSFIDENRKELFDDNQESYREMTVKAWYPSDTESKPEPYLQNAEAEFVVKYLKFPEIYKNLQLNSSRDVPLSTKENKYPILIFSHGWGEHYSQNSILMEELASHGYTVFSIAHHYECKFSSFPDGRLIYIDMNNQRFQNIMQEQQNPKAMELLQQMHNTSNDEERMKVLVETSNTLPTILTESPKHWAEDHSFFIDRLKDINSEHKIFKDKLDLDRIGVFGMSLGGMATVETCINDNRVKAGINIDGGLYGTLLERKLQTPFMFLNSKRYIGYGKIFTGKSTMDCYSLSVRDSDHYNFSDYSIYPVPSIRFLLGTIDGTKTIEIMNVIVVAFFDKYLKKQDIDLIKQAKVYSEIEIMVNIKQQ